MFLPLGKPAIAGLEIAGMMHAAKGIGGDYYDYIPIDEHTIQLVIADVAGKGVAAALLMSATAAAVQLEVNQRARYVAGGESLEHKYSYRIFGWRALCHFAHGGSRHKKPETSVCELWPQSRPSL